jgi:hypothetical protein
MNAFYDVIGIKIFNIEFDRGLPFDKTLQELANRFPHYEESLFLWKKFWHKMLGNKIEGSIRILESLRLNKLVSRDISVCLFIHMNFFSYLKI